LPFRDICCTRDPAAGPDVAEQGGGVDGVVALADVLAHLEGGDGVERAVRDLAVVLDPDLDASFQPAFPDAGVNEGLLLHREGDPDDVDAAVLRGVQAQRAPAATDVEHPHPRGQAELLADEVQLVPLGVLESVPG
jgi:hypothetical protein